LLISAPKLSSTTTNLPPACIKLPTVVAKFPTATLKLLHVAMKLSTVVTKLHTARGRMDSSAPPTKTLGIPVECHTAVTNHLSKLPCGPLFGTGVETLTIIGVDGDTHFETSVDNFITSKKS
jgi:hypothetical protein